MIYQPFEQLESLYLESKLITSKNFIGTYFGHRVTISDLGAVPQSRPLQLVWLYFAFGVSFHIFEARKKEERKIYEMTGL